MIHYLMPASLDSTSLMYLDGPIVHSALCIDFEKDVTLVQFAAAYV